MFKVFLVLSYFSSIDDWQENDVLKFPKQLQEVRFQNFLTCLNLFFKAVD
jgi:hypothetical protein